MTDPLLPAELRVECNMTNPPKPVLLAVLQDGRVTALLTYEQVKAAMERFDVLRNEAHRNSGGRTMSNEVQKRRRQQLEEAAREALRKLFEHMGNSPSVQFPLDDKWVRVEIKPDPATS